MCDLTILRARRQPQGRGRLEIILNLEVDFEGYFEVEGNFKGMRDLEITLHLDLEGEYDLHVEGDLKGGGELDITLDLEI